MILVQRLRRWKYTSNYYRIETFKVCWDDMGKGKLVWNFHEATQFVLGKRTAYKLRNPSLPYLRNKNIYHLRPVTKFHASAITGLHKDVALDKLMDMM